MRVGEFLARGKRSTPPRAAKLAQTPFLRKWETTVAAAAFIHCKNIRVAVKGTFAISLVGHFYYVAKTVEYQSKFNTFDTFFSSFRPFRAYCKMYIMEDFQFLIHSEAFWYLLGHFRILWDTLVYFRTL